MRRTDLADFVSCVLGNMVPMRRTGMAIVQCLRRGSARISIVFREKVVVDVCARIGQVLVDVVSRVLGDVVQMHRTGMAIC